MAKLTFLRVLRSNLKCAVCKEQNCPVRYYPERKQKYFFGGNRYFVSCEKDRKAYIKKSFKKHLP